MVPVSEQRKKTVFRAVVREYLKTAEPVGSETVAEKYGIDASSATIRNDMSDLEDRGLLEQPHTSAGRIPTSRGYRFYVTEFTISGQAVPEEDRQRIDEIASRMRRNASTSDGLANGDAAFREFARAVASLTDETVFVSVGSRTFYVTGVANLVRKPEFHEPQMLENASKAIDELDEMLADVRRRVVCDIEVLIGDENPLGDSMASVVARVDAPSLGQAIMGILGPRRMDYDANVALARYIRELLSNY